MGKEGKQILDEICIKYFSFVVVRISPRSSQHQWFISYGTDLKMKCLFNSQFRAGWEKLSSCHPMEGNNLPEKEGSSKNPGIAQKVLDW